jgi:hypothetical protein
MAISALLTTLEYQSFHARWSAAKALEKINSEAVLPHLRQIYFRQPEHYLKRTVSTIQNRCNFYNYAIWQEAVATQKMAQDTPEVKTTDPTRNIFPDVTEVKIFERVEHYYEHPPDSAQ